MIDGIRASKNKRNFMARHFRMISKEPKSINMTGGLSRTSTLRDLLDWQVSPAVPIGHMHIEVSGPTAAHRPPLRHFRLEQAAELHSTVYTQYKDNSNVHHVNKGARSPYTSAMFWVGLDPWEKISLLFKCLLFDYLPKDPGRRNVLLP